MRTDLSDDFNNRPVYSYVQVYAWGDNDHGQQGNGTTLVNRKPASVQGFGDAQVNRVACGSSHSVAWCATDQKARFVADPVLFNQSKDPLGTHIMGELVVFPDLIKAR